MSGLTASEGPPPMPMKIRAASRLEKSLVSPAHMLEKTRINRLIKMTGRRPKVLAIGTHHKLETPTMRLFTAIVYDNVEKGLGGSPNMDVDAYTGNALEIEALLKVTTNGSNDMTSSVACLRHMGRLSGSAGSAEGCGTRRISSWLVCDAVHSRCSGKREATH